MSAVALITDLFFVTKVKGTADAMGVPLEIVRGADALASSLERGPRLVIVDMNAAGDPAEAIRRSKSLPDPPVVIAYLSHVQQELADAARVAGADVVMPRSAFSAQLPDLLRQHAAEA